MCRTAVGSSRGPSRHEMATVPTTSGTPTSANEKNGNGPAPASCRSLGDDDVDRAAGQHEQRSGAAREGQRHRASATAAARPASASITTSGSSAATAPLSVIRAASTAHSRQTATSDAALACSGLPRRSPPAQAVTPVESMPSLTTNSVAMKMTTGSPKPASTAVKSAGRSPTGQRGEHRDHPDRQPVPDEQATASAEDDQAHRGVIHRLARQPNRCTGAPGPTECRSGTRR